jgi:hypothetical protein
VTREAGAAAAGDTPAVVLARRATVATLVVVTTAYRYGTAHSVVMVGAFGAHGMTPRQIGPAHATIGRVNGRSRQALCGAYVAVDEQLPWPPEGYSDTQLCAECSTLAAL